MSPDFAEEPPVAKRPRSSQATHYTDDMDLAELAALAGVGALEGDAAREEALTSEHLLNLVFSHLCLEDLCRAAMVRQRWREVTSNPEFWRCINLKGRTLMVSKVRALLSRHTEVRVLNARGVAFTQPDLAALLPSLNQLESLELEKAGYDRGELEAVGANLPSLTRLVLAGGLLGPQMSPEWTSLCHSRLQSLHLEAGRAARLRITAPQLTSLSLRDFSAAAVQMVETGQLAELAVNECSKLTDGALRGLLCLEGQGAAVLPALTSVRLATVPNASDETLRLLGHRQTALASLSLSGCGALTGAGLNGQTGFAALRCLSVEFCDSLTGNNLSEAVRELRALEELRVAGCAQVTTLRLQSSHLARLALRGTRALQELDLRCARLGEVDIAPLNPGLAASLALKRIVLASHAVERLQWSAFPALESVRLQCPNLVELDPSDCHALLPLLLLPLPRTSPSPARATPPLLQCPNLRELDLSECHALKDTVFESLGSGLGGPGGYVTGDPISPGCPQLRVLKLGDCEALRHAALRSQTLESLQLSQCSWLQSVELGCPMLTQLSLEECTHLEKVALQSRRMQGMSLGTCPRLEQIAIQCDTMQQLDLRGCNMLQSLQLACPALRSIDATFCQSLSDAAIQSMARCQSLEHLLLANCEKVPITISGLAPLSQLAHLQRLDLSYTAFEDPTPIYLACRHLTALNLSNNYSLRPEALLPLFPKAAAAWEQAGPEALACPTSMSASRPASAVAALLPCPPPAAAAAAAPAAAAAGPAAPLLPELRILDIGYCSMPASVLASVVRRASRLRSLSINGCRGGVTDTLWPLLHRRASYVAAAVTAAAVPATPALSMSAPALCSGTAPLESVEGSAASAGTRLAESAAAGAVDAAAAVLGDPSVPAPAALPPCTASPGPASSSAGRLACLDLSRNLSRNLSQACSQSAAASQADGQALPLAPLAVAGRHVQHELRSLSMVGSKELRSFCLGLVPAAAALEHGLLIGGGTVVVTPQGQQYVPVDSVLGGLRELRMSLSGRLRDLALGLPELEVLQLNNCSELASLVLHCPRLTHLSLQACRALSQAELLAAVARCPCLLELDLQYCPLINPEVVAALRAACPTLQTVYTTPPRAASP